MICTFDTISDVINRFFFLNAQKTEDKITQINCRHQIFHKGFNCEKCQLYKWCIPKADNKHDPLRSNWEVSRFTVIEMKCDPFATAANGGNIRSSHMICYFQ